ncbi:hypothetical protein BEWA_018440 [Theileria equi strain WA]|uniref:Uncharacterized protein n=1 Tax=Theileria equi strain WA TaxID=1537102 RepID=L0AVT3_THEEQ|nr:hypothetical protein BEWA_018440 [Theileria equi strain WA]AFZ78999.1 hypothetical protein BEWA_018440 [Theileria equi strain WA]|eukprot:XP_004828665.1 hypothetical protein BEWA_018440 [Theileria equi strain WA]
MMEKQVQGAASEAESSNLRVSSRPTLFNLLEVLASDSMTTPSQRQCIRDIVTEFLANKFEHSKVYSYIGAVVGHDRLHSVIKQLESDTDRAPLPDQNGLMRIESAFNLTKSYRGTSVRDPKPVQAPVTNGMGTAGYSSGAKDDILLSIRRNLSVKRPVEPANRVKTNLSSIRTASAGVLLQKACWLPIRRTLSAGPLYGHSLICIGSRAYLLGGSNGRSQGLNLARAHVVNLVDFSSKQIMFSGDIPSHREGNTCNVAIIQQTHAIIIFGGFNGERFFNDIYILDLEKRKWIRKHTTGRAPPPRDEHSALVYPARCESAQKSNTGATYLFVFGGKTGLRNQFQCLNDMWAYDILNSSWAQVECSDSSKPSPRFGVCALWADDDTICVFGGETSSANGFVDRNERCLLDDLWMFRLNGPLSGTWTNDQYEGNIGPRSHYSSIFIAQRCKEFHTGVPKTIERLMLLTGGLTYAPGNKRTVVASDKLYFYFFSQRRWYSLKPNYPRNYVGEPFEPRQLHVACFFEKRNILFPGTKPSVPCIFFHGGFHKKQILSDAWVLSLTGEDLFFKNSVLSPVDTVQSKGTDIRDIRVYPPWFYRESHSPGLLWALCSAQRWAFGAIAHLVSNALKESVSSSRIHIRWEVSPQGDEGMLSIQDDGTGLDYTAMNKLLKLFGQSKTGERNPSYEYGCGFKMAFARIASSCAVMSRAHDSIGIGMLSLELMGQCESREMAAPMCMWKLPSKELINRDGACMVDQRHHQRLLMSYSPFNSAALLAEQINVLGVSPGTRILFWQIRDDLDNLFLSKEDGTILLNSSSVNDVSTMVDSDGKLQENSMNSEDDGDASENVKAESADSEVPDVPRAKFAWEVLFPLWTESKYSPDYCLPTYLYWLHLYSSCSLAVQDCELSPYIYNNVSENEPEEPTISQAYSCARNGCDYCGVSPIGRSLSGGRNLLSFLRKRLFKSVEIPFLFHPSDHSNGCFALVGFLNDNSNAIQEAPSDDSERVCEAGILLYFKGRLIRRLEGHFPAPSVEIDGAKSEPNGSLFKGELYRFALTAIISVPDWLIPAVNKQEFVHENNRVFFEFKTKLLKLLNEYCRVCLNDEERMEWQTNRIQELMNYDQTVNSNRSKRPLDRDSDEEQHPNWGHESPPINPQPDANTQSDEPVENKDASADQDVSTSNLEEISGASINNRDTSPDLSIDQGPEQSLHTNMGTSYVPTEAPQPLDTLADVSVEYKEESITNDENVYVDKEPM